MNKYIDDRIENMIMSKLQYHKMEINYYFKNRHKGLAGIDNDMIPALVRGSIRTYRVWREMDYRNYKYLQS